MGLAVIELRPYQEESIQAVLDYWRTGGGNPLVELATGLGKSVVIAELVRRLLQQYPSMRVLMLVHVRELVQQNYMAMRRLWPEAPCGLYSASLNKREAHHPITFASIQSVYKKAGLLGRRDLILVDEAHLLPHGDEGMYHRLINGLRAKREDMRIAGFTATPFRMGSGRLDQGQGRLFDKVVYSYGIGRGIENGWLSSLISRASSEFKFDASEIAKRGGEFVSGALEAAIDKDELTRKAVDEMLKLGMDRRSCLVFCSGVKHAEHVAKELKRRGCSAEYVTGETPPQQRAMIIERFRQGALHYLTNAQVLTTGFDAPNTDMIAFLRPTLSTGLYLQMIGRGVRKAEGKEDCLVLDFAGNVRRHGPVDAVHGRFSAQSEASGADEKINEGDIRSKTCPQCQSLIPTQARKCRHCGYEYPIPQEKPKHDGFAHASPVLKAHIQPTSLPVTDWQFNVHTKQGMPDSLRVTYFAGVSSIPEWVCFAHGGVAGARAEKWWIDHGGAIPAPLTAQEAIERGEEVTCPHSIAVQPDGSYQRIVGRLHNRKAVA